MEHDDEAPTDGYSEALRQGVGGQGVLISFDNRSSIRSGVRSNGRTASHARHGQRVRTGLIVVPAIGIGIALQLLVGGLQAERAYCGMFALAAWLGSTFVTESPDEDNSDTGATDTTDDGTDTDGRSRLLR